MGGCNEINASGRSSELVNFKGKATCDGYGCNVINYLPL